MDILQIRLNPFRTGRCLSTALALTIKKWLKRLNPFRTGRCLSTQQPTGNSGFYFVSIPFEQGDVFRPHDERLKAWKRASQSLSNRAMSFDRRSTEFARASRTVSIPFEQGDVFRHRIEAKAKEIYSVSIPFEQGDVFRLYA